MGTVYLIHFERPLHHARHYIGWASFVALRIQNHRSGHGARLMAVVTEAGIAWKVVRTWRNRGRRFERYLKNLKDAASLCPVCCINRPSRLKKLRPRKGRYVCPI